MRRVVRSHPPPLPPTLPPLPCADWCDAAKACTLFDFVLKGTLQEAVKNVQYDRLKDKDGKAPGLMGARGGGGRGVGSWGSVGWGAGAARMIG